MLHHIQRSILDQLASKESGRYSEINTNQLDGNTFIYHVRQLIASKYIIRNDNGTYSLTQKGKVYIVHRYEDRQKEAHSVFLIALKDDSGNYLLRRRLVQPHLNFSGFVHGEPKDDETIVEAAKKRLYDKTGLRADLRIFNSGLVKIYSKRQLESFSHCIVVTADTPSGTLVHGDKTGENFWQPAQKIDPETTLPSTMHIIDMIERDDQSFFELSYSLDR